MVVPVVVVSGIHISNVYDNCDWNRYSICNTMHAILRSPAPQPAPIRADENSMQYDIYAGRHHTVRDNQLYFSKRLLI